MNKAYKLAQNGIAKLKTSVHLILEKSEQELTNAEIGRTLGIYHGHSGKHEGHISRAILEMLHSEGVVSQDPSTKKWSLANFRK